MARDMDRPQVMQEMSASQMNELEQQVAEGDRDEFNTRAESYGWTREQCDEVWSWFMQRPLNQGGIEEVSPPS